MRTWIVTVAILAGSGCGMTVRQDIAPLPEAKTLRSYHDRCDDDPARLQQTREATLFSPRGDKRNPFRAVAMVTMKDASLCSAVLIAVDRLVTAAHCFDSGKTIQKLAFVDETDAISPSLPVAAVKIHPEYQNAQTAGKTLRHYPQLARFDVAVIKLAEGVTDRSPISFARPEDRQPLARGKLISLVGYGDWGYGAGIKRFARSHVGEVVTHRSKFDDLILLDSQTGSGACPGDSGGGVFIKSNDEYRLIGMIQGINDVLYPGFPIDSCQRCPQGIGIVKQLRQGDPFL